MSQIVINGNNIDILKKYPDNYFDAVVTDPPYGLGKEPNAAELMKDWVEHGYHEVSGSGFMGKEWDAFVPQPVFWKEVFRVLKHGGHVLSFFGTRTYDWGVMSMRFAGFEVRDCIQWLYGSGFPKSHNISKALDKLEGAEREIIGDKVSIDGRLLSSRVPNAINKYQGGFNTYSDLIYNTKITAPATQDAKLWEGWGSALKPANEPIVLARKPLEKGLSIAENILKWGVGGINIDATRIGVSENDPNHRHNPSRSNEGENSIFGVGGHNGTLNSNGRFPANIILTHHTECECKGTKKVGKGERRQHEDGEVSSANEGYTRPNKSSYTHKDSSVIANYGEETIENWDCHEDCPIRILDEQSGVSKSSNAKRTRNTLGSFGMPNDETPEYSDKGGASRFFYVAKASKAERNKGLEGFEEKASTTLNKIGGEGSNFKTGSGNERNIFNSNFHPTVKPVKLMQYLVKMITPPNGIVLDPFCGSGTTGVACKLDGFQFVGMEQDPEYSKIAEGRIKNYKEEKEKTPKNKPKEDKQPINTQTTLF
jgi:site-specific DNA-methyltransferase (adenine-specific)